MREELMNDLAPEVREKLERYVELLLAKNREFNLTRITDESEAWERHVVESLRVLELVPTCKRLLDVGSGGGLPGMVLAIARPEMQVTLLEATSKKARFLESTGQDLGLSNLTVVSERAEEAAAWGQPLRESFDVVTARAVAAMRVLLELTVPFLRVGGTLVAVKGQKAGDELRDAKRALSLLRVELLDQTLQPTATVVRLKKLEATPKRFPRRPGEPKRKPL